MLVLAIDPGSEQSAYALWDGEHIIGHDKVDNSALMAALKRDRQFGASPPGRVVIEKIASYGMAVGAEVFETVYWSGIFACAFGLESVDRMPRLEVKLWLCKDSKAKDANIRQALLDRFGGKATAIGKKASPGPLYGVAGDVWSALAVAVTWHDKHIGKVAA